MRVDKSTRRYALRIASSVRVVNQRGDTKIDLIFVRQRALLIWCHLLLFLKMETPAFVYAVFLWFLLLSITGYSIYVGFGPPSKELKDPFEEHED